MKNLLIMKKTIFILALSTSFVAFGCNNSNAKQTKETTDNTAIVQQKAANVIENVEVKTFKKLIATKKGQLVDVRTPQEWESGTIEGATKINFFDKNFQEQLMKLDKNKPVYVYCATGGRSGKAAKQMEKMGFKKVYNLNGGITAWKAAGEKTSK